MQKIRLGIELNHVIRDINRQIIKYYQKDFDESVDIDDIDMSCDVLHQICRFNDMERIRFLYEDYPLEVFGHANQCQRFLSRDLNIWMQNLTNQEEYDVDIFIYSMKEVDLAIQSSYFFLSKIGSRVRKVIFPKSLEELSEYGDVFITANPEVVDYMKDAGKGVVLINRKLNKGSEEKADLNYNSFRDFLDDDKKLNNISKLVNICPKAERKLKRKSFWTLITSWSSFWHQTSQEK